MISTFTFRLRTFIYTIIGVLLLSNNVLAFITDDSVNITPPVGKDILPGGDILKADNVKDSFIFTKLIPFAIKYAIRLAAALAVIAVIYGGYMYMTAYGDEDKHKKAQSTIIYALLGLILAITAFGIIKILTNIQI